ncbi:hypothetical protein VM1G_02119 [Cytospora mali]|uniref:Uncharacterized protein n=1 Tax=Cytospora mali TaxID=578113 RepID=A0A194VR27_CYTMA|nr:hypothetical protein VM1G_02119 [Valsa mali]
MDIQDFTAIVNKFFITVIMKYQAETQQEHELIHSSDLDVHYDLLMSMLNSMFWDPITLDQPSDSVSIYERVQEALKLVFWYNPCRADLDITAVKKVLPEWPTIFGHIFNPAIRSQLPRHAPAFDIWDFTSPIMTVDKFLQLLNKHIATYRHLHEIEGIVLQPWQPCLILKPNGQANARPTKGTKHDPNYFHRCMFCTHLDTNEREDASVDHMQRVHNYYLFMEYRLRRACEVVHQKRKDSNVLKALITKERAVYNSLVTRLHEARKAVAAMKGTRYLVVPRLRDVQGDDLDGLGRVQLAQKLCTERAQLVGRDLESDICQTNACAWKAGREDYPTLRYFDWTGEVQDT